MPDLILLPPRPSREALIRFFTEQEPLPVRYAADLLGWPWPQLLIEVRDVGALLPEERVPWVEVAFRLINTWPRRWLLETLGEAAVLLPRELHLTPVAWELPIYLVRAMERQAVFERRDPYHAHGTDVEDYVAELLHLSIEKPTVDSFRGDRSFFDAYDYPNVDPDMWR
jgi:hypothetical protein